jgi:ADP-ribosylglycohydrolase
MSTPQAQGSFYTTGVDTFSPLEKHYLVVLRSLRKRCHENVKAVLDAERTWQEKREREKQAWKKNAEEAREVVGLGMTSDDAVMEGDEEQL